MFPTSYFAPRHFAPRYFPPGVAVVEEEVDDGFWHGALWTKKRKNRRAELERLERCRIQDECDLRDIVTLFMMSKK